MSRGSPLDRPADWLTAHEALERILATLRPLPPERVPLADALGRVLAEPIVSPVDQPPWTNSGMDGYACRSDDVAGASAENPRVLHVIEEVPAGAFPSRPIAAGEAVRLMTGAPVPEGADTVVRLEHTEPRAEGRVAVLRDWDAGRNLRERGEDLRAGETVLGPGRVLRPAEIGVLASVGRSQVGVTRRARVAILSNGDELVDLDEFDQVLAGRRIVSSNSYALAAAVRAAGGEPLVLGIARDTRASLREHLARAAGADALVTTAGASVGDHDLMKDVLEELGYRLDFWRVKVPPGSPFSFGRLGDGAAAASGGTPASPPGDVAAAASGGTPAAEGAGLPVFGLPGNPVSALVTFEVFVHPALRKLHGRGEVYPPTLRVRTAHRIESRPGLMRFLRATLERDGAGGWLARLTGPQGSGILTSVARADALLVVPLDLPVVEAGTELLALPLRAADAAAASAPF